MDKVIKEVEKRSSETGKAAAPSLFRKKTGDTPEVVSYLGELEETCFVCDKIDHTLERYIVTVFYLYRSDVDFRTKFKSSKGFCTSHYKQLYLAAAEQLSGNDVNEFRKVLNDLYLENMKRVCDDLEWFITKFDYRFENEPWKNAKDALLRSMQKTNSIL